MNIIDEKGRLFGKINIIDFLALLFLLCVLPLFYFGYKIFRKPAAQIVLPQKPTSLDVYCRISNLKPAELERIGVGDVFIDDAGNKIGQILSVGQPGIYSYSIDLGNGHIVAFQDTERRQVLVKARILGEVRNDAFYYRGEKTSIGSKIQLKTDKYNVEGLIDSETRSSFLELVEININLKPLEPEEVKSISVGDVFVDDAGNNIGEILSVGEPQVYTYDVDLGNGNIASHQDPARRQVLINASILGEVRNGAFYYKEKKIIIGSQIQLKTKKYALGGIVELAPKSSMPMLIEPEHVLLKIRFKDLIPEIAELVKVGDEEKDDAGFLIKKIKSIVSSGPGQNVIVYDGKMIIAEHPVNKDIVLEVEMICNKNVMRVGNPVSLKTDKYNIDGKIIGINN